MTTVDEARRELFQKTRAEIEEETAFKWAARAVAAYQLSAMQQPNRFLRDAEDYYHEAIEHAALADHSGGVLRRVREWFHQYVPHGAL